MTVKMETRNVWKNVFLYYLIAVVLTWSASFLIIGGAISSKLHYLVGYGPTIAALIVLFIKKKELVEIRKNLFRVPNQKIFWLFGTSPVWIALIIYLVMLFFGVSVPPLSSLGEVSFLGNIGLWTLPLWLFTFGVGEEIGWRGFLLPVLQNKYSILTSTLIVWIFWLLWHFPFFFYLPTYMNMGVGGTIGFAFSLLSGTILLNWLYNYSKKSVLTTALWHGLFNFITATAFGAGNIAIIFSMIVIIVSIVIVVKWLIPKKT